MTATETNAAPLPHPTFSPGPRALERTPAAWTAEPYTRFTVQPMSPTIGAVIDGVSMADDLDDEMFGQLDQALLEWKVLFFRGQDVTGDQHRDFAARWGALESHPFIGLRDDQPAGKPEVVRFEKGPDLGGYENTWHSDVSWRANPSLGSILRAVEVPAVGGDTLWADMGAAYDGLPDHVKERIDGLVAVHDWITTFGLAMDAATRDGLRPDFPAVEHPVVRTHPETGRRTLYVNQAFTQHIVGLPADESLELLEYLYAQAAVPEYQCRHHWQPGDVAFWDNRATQHYASSDYFPSRRVMERITVIGDRPF
jgi:taurine dioxygenase